MASSGLSEKSPLRVVVVGGSLSGLMCGIALKNAGHDVKIIEKDHDERQSHMSGICLGPSAIAFFAKHDSSAAQMFSHETDCLQVIKKEGDPRVLVKGRRMISSWDTLYYRLRAMFDSYSSPSRNLPLQIKETEGISEYHSSTQLLDIKHVDDDDSKMELQLLDCLTDKQYSEQADLIIGADGSNSMVRQRYVPDSKSEYAGYVAWRGTIPESEVSIETRQIFNNGITLHLMKQHHCVVYTIPGPNGSVNPGERLLNFLWYTNEDESSLSEIMVDAIDGHRHRTTVPAGHVRPEVWAMRVERAKRDLSLPQPWVEIISKIREPFVQAISHHYSTQVSFEEGKVLLMGDAVSQFCPHTGLSSAQAAYHTSRVVEYAARRISLRQYEEDVTGYSYIYWLQSVYWGRFYQAGVLATIGYGLHFWATVGFDLVRNWWIGRRSTRVNEFQL